MLDPTNKVLWRSFMWFMVHRICECGGLTRFQQVGPQTGDYVCVNCGRRGA